LTEQYDSEIFKNTTYQIEDSYTQPSCTKTWYHSGIFGWESKRYEQYYRKDSNHHLLSDYGFELDHVIDGTDFEQALRILSGKVIRQEVYSTSPEGIHNENPYSVSQIGYSIRKIQAKTPQDTAVFFAFQSETLTHHYCEEATD